MPDYKVMPANPETVGLGATGKMIYKLIKENKPALYKKLKEDNSLTTTIRRWEEQYNTEMLCLVDGGKNPSEAREIAWPEITAQFGM